MQISETHFTYISLKHSQSSFLEKVNRCLELIDGQKYFIHHLYHQLQEESFLTDQYK